MPEQFVPDWVDRRTAEWCAQLCDAVEARLMSQCRYTALRGAKACAAAIRTALDVGNPKLPAVIEKSDAAAD